MQCMVWSTLRSSYAAHCDSPLPIKSKLTRIVTKHLHLFEDIVSGASNDGSCIGSCLSNDAGSLSLVKIVNGAFSLYFAVTQLHYYKKTWILNIVKPKICRGYAPFWNRICLSYALTVVLQPGVGKNKPWASLCTLHALNLEKPGSLIKGMCDFIPVVSFHQK